MIKHYEKLLQLKCFTHQDSIHLFGDAKKAGNILYELKKKGLIQSVRRNLYVAVSLETHESAASPFEIASSITDGCCLSHHSAFEFYGLANQVFTDIYVSSPAKFREFTFEGRRYHCVRTARSFGLEKYHKIRVTDLERTILDGLKDFDKIGGLEELLRCLAMVTLVREQVLIDYLGHYDNCFLAQKAGYLLSFFPHLKLSEPFFEYCRQHKGESSRYLCHDTKNAPKTFIKEWNLCVPADITEWIQEGGDAFVPLH